MKLLAQALTTLISISFLAGCADFSSDMDTSSMWPDQNQNVSDINTTPAAKKPRVHFTRGEQVGDEVPYTDSTSTTSNAATAKTATANSASATATTSATTTAKTSKAKTATSQKKANQTDAAQQANTSTSSNKTVETNTAGS